MSQIQPVIQSILTGIIVLAAIGYAIWKLVKKVKSPDHNCSDCSSGGCVDCSLADLKREIEKAGEKKLETPPYPKK